MKIRTQYYMAIVPVFLGLTLIVYLFSHRLILQEIEWGKQEESTAYILSLGSILFENEDKLVAINVSYHPENLSDKINNLLKHSSITNLSIYSSNGKIIYDHNNNENTSQLSPSVIQELKQQKSPIINTGYVNRNNQNVYSAIGSALPTDASPIFKIEILDTYSNIKNQNIFSHYIFITFGIITILSIILASFLSRFITTNLRKLEVNKELSSDKNLQNKVVAVKEINNLKDAIETMHAVLSESFIKNKREIVESEQLRDDGQILQKLRGDIYKPIYKQYNQIELAISEGGIVPNSCFHDYLIINDIFCVYYGIVDNDKSDDPVLNSMVVSQLIKNIFTNFSLEDGNNVIQFIPGLLELYGCNISGNHLTEYHYKKGKNITKIREADVTDELCLTGNLPENAFKMSEIYSKNYKEKPLMDIAQKISILLANQTGGVFILYRKAKNIE